MLQHNGEEVVLKEMLCKHWDEEGKKIQNFDLKILNSVKNHKHVTNIKKVCYSLFVITMHYSNFSFTSFSADVNESIISLDEFCTGNFMLEYFQTFLNKIAFDIMGGLKFLHSRKIVHRELKPGNVVMVTVML